MKAACVLYNFCIMEGDNYGDDQQDRGSSLSDQVGLDGYDHPDGEATRELVMA